MVLGHLTVTAAGHRILGGRARWIAAVRLGPLLLGAYLPDLVDKPLNNLVGLSGRGYGHSLAVQVLALGMAWAFARRHRQTIQALALGAAVHLIEDWVEPVVLLAPFLGPVPYAPHWSFLDNLLGFYLRGGPPVWIEIAALCYWTAVGARSLAVTAAPEAGAP
jgi:membrane-bound metal-dependent hydrolase YbcI (DUF457 family)